MKEGDKVRHGEFGVGSIEMDRGETVIARFGENLQECRKDDLSLRQGVEDAIAAGKTHDGKKVVCRAQAVAIRSANDSWGVFSPSRIKLFPHQLWVCREVSRKWPMRWLIADDVGLGKTIEAGLILWALKASGKIRRFLVLCPASLVKQWSDRMYDMFDLRVSEYHSDLDSKKDRFWDKHDEVVASFHTLRENRNERWERMTNSKGWDLVIVDEAHHLNADEQGGLTKAYRMVGHLNKARKTQSLLFFTGTPHRGKNFGFFALLNLLRPDLFDPSKPPKEQYGRLKEAVIRNNKQEVTDLDGTKLFQEPRTINVEYSYNEEEEYFYGSLESFIREGKAYSQGLSKTEGAAIGLILATMQKLAASSIASILSALRNRRHNFEKWAGDIETNKPLLIGKLKATRTGDAQVDEESDRKVEEMIDSHVRVLRDEELSIEQLIGYAEVIKSETKMNRLMELIREEHADDSILFFTEYKATQSVLVQLLREEYGATSTGFINGDNYLFVDDPERGRLRLLSVRRDLADAFNEGRKRFLVSTEAAGEGIDLQGNCHVLIHVDLPWNPMRLHQRVGRLNRIGQKEQVVVYNLTNPNTIEAKIRSMLNQKIDVIMRSMTTVMEQPEDLAQLILGVPSPGFFEELYAEGMNVHKDKLSDWFDAKTGQLGGHDAVETVTELVGNASRFDFTSAIAGIPRLDLPDLENFFRRAASINGRRVMRNEEGLSVKTPEAWKLPMGEKEMKGISFERQDVMSGKKENCLAVGHAVFDKAILQAEEYEDCVCVVSTSNPCPPLALAKVFDRLTATGDTVSSVAFGFELTPQGVSLLKDWELLEKLNKLSFENCEEEAVNDLSFDSIARFQDSIEDFLQNDSGQLETGFEVPESEILCIIWPVTRK
jgi:superfamily II DNA or RNA helicase